MQNILPYKLLGTTFIQRFLLLLFFFLFVCFFPVFFFFFFFKSKLSIFAIVKMNANYAKVDKVGNLDAGF